MGKYYHWRGSTEADGSPAAAAAPAIGVVVNEVLSNPDAAVEPLDAIELYNPSPQTIAVGGWYVSNSGANPQKYQIPSGTELAPGQFLVITEADFNPSPGNPGTNDFELDGIDGDDVWVTILDATGQIVSFVDDVHFGGAVQGESFGRSPDAVWPPDDHANVDARGRERVASRGAVDRQRGPIQSGSSFRCRTGCGSADYR